MKELYIKVSPTIFNYSGAIVEDGFLVQELTSIPKDLIHVQQYALDHDCGTIVLCGNIKFTSGLKNQIEEFPTNFNRKINIRLEEVNG